MTHTHTRSCIRGTSVLKNRHTLKVRPGLRRVHGFCHGPYLIYEFINNLPTYILILTLLHVYSCVYVTQVYIAGVNRQTESTRRLQQRWDSDPNEG